ncbi:MAG: hypothetical protein IJW48_04505 [Clostridia bacterium]|nr:hypothetical protein [Clostridia bacterium]
MRSIKELTRGAPEMLARSEDAAVESTPSGECGYFYATSGRMSYEIYIDGIITYEPRAKELFSFPLRGVKSIRIRGLFYGKDGILKNSRVLGELNVKDGEECFILCNEHRSILVSRNEFQKKL